jgi:hypothetical protein
MYFFLSFFLSFTSTGYSDMDSGFLLLMYYTPLSRVMFIGSRTWPPLHLDAVVAMRSESRAAPRAIATVIFSFCFFVTSTVRYVTRYKGYMY